tara:strand:- start:1404 stop:2111 length:708 start_codon:yes stop_codon:yes gene_type:complete
MADSDYTVAVVLQASDEGMSAGIKKAAEGIEDASDKAKTAKINFMALMVGLEGLTSGLNQLTGGMRKMTAAMTQTGMATEDQTKKLNEQIAMVELFTGPMESMIAVVKLATVIHAAYTGIVAIETGVVITATIANYGLAASMALVTIGFVGFIAIAGLAFILLTDTERGLDLVSAGLDKTAAAIHAVNDGVRALIDLAVSGGQAVGDFFDNIQGPGGSLLGQDGTKISMGGGALA